MTSAPKKKAPVRLSGNSGTRYENEVAARFLLDILAGTNSLGSDFGMILRIDWQSRDLGWFGDDLAINCRDLAGETRSIGISIKSNQQVTNKGFPSDFVELAWAQWLEVPTARPFRRGKDAIGLVLAEISPSVFSDWSALLKEILSTTPDRIVSRLAATKPSGSQSSDMQRLLVQSFACPDHYKEDRPPEEVIKLLHDIRVLPLDFTHPTSQSKVAALCSETTGI